MDRDDRRLDEELHTLLRQVDHPPPAVRVEDVIARAERRGSPWIRTAAALALAFATAGVAWALPGSPVPGWVRGLGGGPADEPPPAPAVSPAPEEGPGLMLSPAGPLVVVLDPGTTRGRVRIALTDGPRIVVRAPPGTRRFTSEPDRLVVEGLGENGTLSLSVPRDTRRIQVVVEGATVFLKNGNRITTSILAPEPDVWELEVGGPGDG